MAAMFVGTAGYTIGESGVGALFFDHVGADALPTIYLAFREAHPEVATALDDLGRATEQAGPLDARTQRLIKVALAVGSLAEGAVRSNTRKALEAGDTAAEIRHVALLAITTRGFPAAVAALKWIDEVVAGSSGA